MRFGFVVEWEFELIGKNHCYTFEAIRVAAMAKYIAKNLPPADRKTELVGVAIDSIDRFSNAPTPERFECAMGDFRRLCNTIENWREFVLAAFDLDRIVERQLELRDARTSERKLSTRGAA